MWAPVSTVFGGNPCSVTVKSAVDAVILPAASFVLCIVIVTVPLPVASAFVTGVGASFDGSKVAVNFGSGAGVGVAGVSLPQPNAAIVSPRAKAERGRRDGMCKFLQIVITRISARG